MSVYGDENKGIVRETDRIKLMTFYAVGKLASEHYMRIYSEPFQIKTTALRLNNVYRPGQNMKNLRQGMVSIFMAQAILQKTIHVMGSKERYCDFVYIYNVVNAFQLAFQYIQGGGYNVSTGIKTSVNVLIDNMLYFLPDSVEVFYQGSIPGDQFGIYCDNRLIYNDLGWRVEVSLTDGFSLMAKWALANY